MNRTPGWRCIFCTIVLVALSSKSVYADDIGAVLEAFEAAGDNIYSFDLLVRCEKTTRLRMVGDKWSPVNPDELGMRQVLLSRQVLDLEGKRRFEKLIPDGTRAIEAKVYTGEFIRTLSYPGQSGVIREGKETRSIFGSKGENDTCLYRDVWQGSRYVELLRSRGDARMHDGLQEGFAVLEVSPAIESDSYPAYGFKFWLDPNRGMMPRRIEVFWKSMSQLDTRWEVDEFKEVESGVWAPVAATIEHAFAGEVYAVTTLQVDLAKSRWNHSVTSEEFLLPYPAGTRVLDTTREIAVLTGNGDTGQHIDELLANATDVFHNPPPSEPQEKLAFWRSHATWTATILLAVVLTLLAYRSRHRV